MKAIIIYCMGLFLIAVGNVNAQQRSAEIFQGNIINSQKEYGNGILGHLVRGDNLMRQGNFEQAMLSYDQAIGQNPDFAEAYIKRAMARYRLGWTERAQQDFEYAARLNPYIADLYGYGGHLRKLNVIAFEPYDLFFKPELMDKLRYYTKMFSGLEETLTSSEARYEWLDWLERRTALYPDNAELYVQKAIIWLLEGELTVARFQLDEAIARRPSAVAYDLKGIIYAEHNAPEMAQSMYAEALKQDSTYAPAHYNLSLLQRADDRLNEDWASAERAIDLDADFGNAYFQRALLSKMLGDNQSAIADYTLLVAENDQRRPEVLFNRAVSKQLSGDVPGALEDINLAIELDQRRAKYYYARGNIYILLERYFHSVNDFNVAIQLQNDFAEAYFNRGIAYLMLNNRANACYDMEQAVQLGYKKGAEKLSYLCNF